MPESKNLLRAKEHLHPNERIIAWSEGICESRMLGHDTKRTGVVVATSERVFVFIPKLFGSFDLEEFPLTTMSSVEHGKNMFGYSLKLIASGNSLRISIMNAGNPQGLIDFVRKQLGRKSEPNWQCPDCGEPNGMEVQLCRGCGKQKAAANSASGEDLSVRLERVASLHAKGLLTLEEFQRAKDKLLSD